MAAMAPPAPTDPATSVLTWLNGARTDVPDARWAALAASFLGCGFRVLVPLAQPGALADARAQAARVAAVLDTRLDAAPWEALAALATPAGSAEVVGGWPYGLGRDSGTPATRVLTTTAPPPAPTYDARARTLPWRVSSRSPLAGLPVVSGLEASVARRHLAGAGDTVGLWTDETDRVATSTHGPLLLHLPGSGWRVAPDDGAVVTHWWSERVAAALGATATGLTPDLLRDADALAALDPLGVVTGVGVLDDRPLAAPDRAHDVAEVVDRLRG